MRKFLLLMSLFLMGCDQKIVNYQPYKFRIKEEVLIKIGSRPAIIVDQWAQASEEYEKGNQYKVRYFDDTGKIQEDFLYEFELNKNDQQ